ncbi:RHS repeat-associated core domain-containing protein [Chitinimonas lacunae]|uniref:RHS repeat-associated core domain-containing protein n=1 Tax=Chitinimonas lacunae TaxID=1963018 RepID=A0ABV8MRC6_9NEIS
MRFPRFASVFTLAAALAALPSQAAITHTLKQEFDQLGRLAKVIQADGSWVSYGYDPNGNRTAATDHLGRTTHYEYDAFNRLTTIRDPKGGITRMGYDAFNNLVKVTDPKGLTTEYQYNGLDQLEKQISPDTGTSSQTYELDGQLKTRTNAAGQTTQFKYDGAGRLIEQRHAGGPNWTFQWDSVGRLSEVKDNTATTRYRYDSQSRLEAKTQQIGTLTQTVSYRWTPANQLSGLTTPSGRVIDYVRQNGQIVAVNLDGKPLLTQVVYQPFGGPQGWTWANGLHHTRLYDTNGRLYRVESAGIFAKRLIFDGASNVKQQEDLQDAKRTQEFGYDVLDRLTSETTTHRNDAYQYDANGNRTQVSRNGTATPSTIEATSNRLTGLGNQTRTYTATGHLQSDGTRTFEYDGAERLVKVTTNGKTYQYSHNAWGERLVKTGVRFVYDEQGHLLGEYKTDGSLIQETVWLGDLPIATIQPDAKSPSKTRVYYVHPDHLGTPRAVSDPVSNKAVWRWESDGFGNSTPDEDPDQDKKELVYNLRFPGQYFDQETGLNYNFFRDYEPITGRYVQSDRWGLYDGVNTYVYAHVNPLVEIDPTGEFAWGLVFGGAELGWQLYQNDGDWSCVDWTGVGLSMVGGGLMNGLFKGAFKFKTAGSHTWDATRKWMSKNNIMPIQNGVQRHHWLFERNQGIGKRVPDVVKNQPWNINPIRSDFNNWLGRKPWRAPLGAPSWAVETAVGTGMTGVGAASGD